MPPTKSGKQTKKTLKRYKKAELIKIGKANGLDVNKKMSKNTIVDKVFKSKKVRSSIPMKDKRKMSEKQKANLERFRIGKDFKNEKIVKQRPQYVAEIRKIEDTEVIGRGQPNEFKAKKKIGEGKGRFRETQVEKLKQQTGTNQREENVRQLELLRTTNKTSDLFDTRIEAQKTDNIKRRKALATQQAKSTKDVRFGQDESASVPGPAGPDSILSLMGLPVTDLVAKLKQLKETAKKENKPLPPVVVVIEDLLKKKRSQ